MVSIDVRGVLRFKGSSQHHLHVIGAQMSTNLMDHTRKQRIARGVTACIVDNLQADDIDIDRNEQAARSTGASDLAINVCQTAARKRVPVSWSVS